jgi:putative flippase GtrA
MFLRFLKYFWSIKKQLAKYFTVGVSGVLIDFGLMIFLKECFGVKPILATAVSQVFSISFIFLANKYWSFGSRHQTKNQIVRYLTVLFFDYVYTIGMMYLFNSIWGFDYRLVRLGTIVLMVTWNFFLYKYFVYRKDKEVVAVVEKKYE